MGIKFPDLASLEATAKAIGSNMYEGFEATQDMFIPTRKQEYCAIWRKWTIGAF
ncbi:MAG: hypothetical protein QM610_01590 [Chitinophagaceae bacterium]